MTHFSGKSAIVCGATSGLGLVLTRQLALQGAKRILLVARTTPRLESLTSQLRDEFPRTDFDGWPADMCSADDVSALSERLRDEGHGGVQLLIQAVGQSWRGSLEALSPEDLQQLLRINVFSSLNAVNLLSNRMANPSSLVLIGSLASKFAPRYIGGYSIAKHALAALAQTARLELASKGIHVTFACPGPIAREDAGQRYQGAASDSLPAEALSPGGGAKLKGLDSDQLARDILSAAARLRPEIIRPRKARLLATLSALSPSLGDWILRKKTS